MHKYTHDPVTVSAAWDVYLGNLTIDETSSKTKKEIKKYNIFSQGSFMYDNKP